MPDNIETGIAVYDRDTLLKNTDAILENFHDFLDAEIFYLNCRIEQGIGAQADIAIQGLYKIAREKHDCFNMKEAVKCYDILKEKDPLSWEANFYSEVGNAYLNTTGLYGKFSFDICISKEKYVKRIMPYLEICEKNAEKYFDAVELAAKKYNLYKNEEKVLSDVKFLTVNGIFDVINELIKLYDKCIEEIFFLLIRLRDYCYRIADFLHKKYSPKWNKLVDAYKYSIYINWVEIWKTAVAVDYLMYEPIQNEEFDGNIEAKKYRQRILKYIQKIVDDSGEKYYPPLVDGDEVFEGKKLYYDSTHEIPEADTPITRAGRKLCRYETYHKVLSSI